MSKLLLLYSTIVISLVFMLIPNNDVTVGYPFSSMVVSLEYYIYSIFEKIVLIVLAYVIACEETEYRGAVQVFFWLMVADLADLLLCYNSIWFHVESFPVSMNIMKSLIFGLVIFNIWMKGLFK